MSSGKKEAEILSPLFAALPFSSFQLCWILALVWKGRRVKGGNEPQGVEFTQRKPLVILKTVHHYSH